MNWKRTVEFEGGPHDGERREISSYNPVEVFTAVSTPGMISKKAGVYAWDDERRVMVWLPFPTGETHG